MKTDKRDWLNFTAGFATATIMALAVSYAGKDETKAMHCECGGNLVFRDEVFEAQLKEQLNGYIYSYECDKCQMLHFYKFKQ
jgi:hypothetical protein